MRWLQVLALVAMVGCKGAEAPPTETGLPVGGELLGVGVAPRDPLAAVGEIVPFYATAYYENTTYADISSEVIWTSTNPRVATIDASGAAQALAEGETEIIAVAPGGSSNKVKLTVLGAGVATVSIAVQPAVVTITTGQTVQLAAVANFDDGSSGTVGAACQWASASPAVASVNSSGLVSALAEGTASVSATCGSYSASAAVTVAAQGVDLGEPNLRVVDFEGIAIGDYVLWFAEVQNDGTAYASGFFVDVVLDSATAPAPGTPYADTAYIAGLAPGESASVYLEREDAPAGVFQSWLLVDPDGFIDESNESDNTAGPEAIDTRPAAIGPDLVVTDAFGYTDGVSTIYYIEIQNLGDQTAQNFWVDLWKDELSEPQACSYGDLYQHVQSLAPGATHTWEPFVDEAPSFLWWDSWVWVDACGDVQDATPSDNVVTFIVEE